MNAIDPPPHGPTPFLRIFEIPSAAPWDQSKAARLKAVHGSPLPVDRTLISVVRVDRWNPDAPSRFCAAYIRRRDVQDMLRWSAVVDGRELEFRFRTAQSERADRRQLALDAGLIAALALLSPLSVLKTLELRAQNHAVVEQALQSDDRELRIEQARLRRARNAKLLSDAGLAGHTGTDLVADLAWAAQSKTPNADLASLKWDSAGMTVTGHGQEAPFAASSRAVARVGAAGDGTTWQVGRLSNPRPAEALMPSHAADGRRASLFGAN